MRPNVKSHRLSNSRGVTMPYLNKHSMFLALAFLVAISYRVKGTCCKRSNKYYNTY